MHLRRSAVAMISVAFLATPAASQIEAGDQTLLRDVARTYSAMSRCLFKGDLTVELTSPRGPQSQTAGFLVAMDRGGRLRDQVDHATEGGAFVSDGRQTWVYNGGLHQWTQRPGGPDSALANPASRGIGREVLQRYVTIGDGASAVRRLGDESVTLDGTPRPCVVLEVTYPQTTNNPQIHEGPRRYWIDSRSHLVLRQRSVVDLDQSDLGGKSQQVETVTFLRAQLDPVLPDSLWTFRPPAGTTEVAEIGPGLQASSMDGEPAAPFTLRDLAGKSHTLAQLKGKIVLLDFWATWCGPCRMTMPRVAKIHQEYKGKGVEVFSVNVGEPAARAAAYIKKNGYAFTTLLDTDTQVATHYKVTGIPTLVVIDRQGVISSYLVGAHSEQTLRTALAKAGVK